jgi:hypothetical protein
MLKLSKSSITQYCTPEEMMMMMMMMIIIIIIIIMALQPFVGP